MRRVLPLALLVLAVAGSISAIWWPMSTDHALFAWVGDTIVQGGLPYRDAWELKGPAVYIQGAFTRVLFGRVMWGMRVVDLLLLGAGCVGVWSVVARVSDSWTGLWAPSLLILLYLPSDWWNTAQPDAWAPFLAAAALGLVLARGGRSRLRHLLAGALLGWLCMYKPPLHLLLVPPVVIAAVTRRDPDTGVRPAECRPVRVLALGAAVPIVAVIAWLGIGGALDDTWATLVGYNARVYSHVAMGRDDLRELLFKPLMDLAPLLTVALAGCLLTWRRDRSLSLALIVWLVGGAAIMGLQQKFFEYHWHVLAPPLAIGGAIGLGALVKWVCERPRRTAADVGRAAASGAVTIGLILWVVLPGLEQLARESIRWLEIPTGEVTLEEYYHGPRFERGYFSLGASLDAADYIRRHTFPSERVLVWGLDPLVYFMSGRLPPTRFGFRYPISTTLREAPSLGEKYYAELLRDLRARPPRYIIVHHDDRRPVHEMTSAELLRSLPELWEFVQSRYEEETVIRNGHLWRRCENVAH